MTINEFFAIVDCPGNRIRHINLSEAGRETLRDSFKATQYITSKKDISFKDNPFYSPNFEEEIFLISSFDDVDGLLKSVLCPIGCATLAQEEITDIKAIYTQLTINGKNIIFIKDFNKKKVLANKKSIFWASNSFEEFSKPCVFLDESIIATYNTESELRFYKLHTIKQIFDMSSYHTIATEDTIDKFISHSLFCLQQKTIDKQLFDSSMKVKIYSISNSGVLDQDSDIIITCAKRMGINIDVNDAKIILPSHKADLKKLLGFLDDDYWESPISDQKYVTNSKRKI